jgi:glucosamine 6-phosphate synthetase-like amidotransferase/phosphosugar isomerase protein
MAVKLALLKSGEQVIADIMELVDDQNKVVSLVFSNPYVARLLTPELLMENSIPDTGEVEHKVAFSPWIVLSADKKMALDPRWVVTIVEPHEWIKKSYEEKMSDSVSETDNRISDICANVSDIDDEESTVVENFEVITEEING